MSYATIDVFRALGIELCATLGHENNLHLCERDSLVAVVGNDEVNRQQALVNILDVEGGGYFVGCVVRVSGDGYLFVVVNVIRGIGFRVKSARQRQGLVFGE